MTNFSDFDLIAPLQRALAEEGYQTPTPIQAKTLPLALEGRDVLGIAQTGTGKTAAFALPILNWLGEGKRKSISKRPFALILAPTRELAIQIGDSLTTYGRHVRLRTSTIFGGVRQGKQVNQLMRGSHILVATPGRLLDLMSQGHLRLDKLEMFVLDEADRMLDMGFLPALKQIIRALPTERQSLFFSATLPPRIKTLANQLLHDPASITIASKSVSVEKIEQQVILVQKGEKQRILRKLLMGPDVSRAIVFTKTKRGANRLSENLEKNSIRSVAIHGNKSQSARQKALAAFRDKRVQVLVATDVAARGIDIPGVSHVVNYDIPHEPESYVHRIGRTGRAGAGGVAISFCLPAERRDLRAIEKLIGKKVPLANCPGGKELPPEQETADSKQSNPKRKRRSPSNAKTATGKPKRKRRRSKKDSSATTQESQQPSRRKGTRHRKKQQHISEEKAGDGQEGQGSGETRKARGKKKTRKRAVTRT